MTMVVSIGSLACPLDCLKLVDAEHSGFVWPSLFLIHRFSFETRLTFNMSNNSSNSKA